MALEIVWRNPASRPPETHRRLERLVADDYGVRYAVRTTEETTVFELILRRAAGKEAAADSILEVSPLGDRWTNCKNSWREQVP